MIEEGDARARLLAAAHRLVAERGMDEVSTREIAAAAGQKNTGAVAYHFGSREGMFRELFRARIRAVNEVRGNRLKAVVATGQEADVRRLLEAVIYPLADNLRSGSGGRDYVRFIVSIAPTISDAAVGNVGQSGAWALGTDIRRMLSVALTDLPPDEREPRIDLVLNLAVAALAYLESRRQDAAEGAVEGPSDLDAEVERIIDVLEGGLAGPPPPASTGIRGL